MTETKQLVKNQENAIKSLVLFSKTWKLWSLWSQSTYSFVFSIFMNYSWKTEVVHESGRVRSCLCWDSVKCGWGLGAQRPILLLWLNPFVSYFIQKGRQLNKIISKSPVSTNNHCIIPFSSGNIKLSLKLKWKCR
jgi:hypothetical protein